MIYELPRHDHRTRDQTQTRMHESVGIRATFRRSYEISP